MTDRISSSSLLLALGLLLLCGPGHAAPPSLQRERDHFERGASLFNEKKYEEAIDEYRSAYAVRQHPTLLINIGLCYLNLREPRGAADAFAQYRSAVPRPPPDVEAKLRG